MTGAQSPPRLSDTVRRGCTYAAGAVSKCVWQDPTGGGPPDWVLRGETPTGAQYIYIGAAASARSTRLLKSCLGARTRCRVEGGLDFGDWYGCVRGLVGCVVGCACRRVGVLSCPEINYVVEALRLSVSPESHITLVKTQFISLRL